MHVHCDQRRSWNNFYTLKAFEVSFVSQYVVNAREFSMCTWKECIFCFLFVWLVGWCNVLKISIKSNCSVVSFRISVVLLIFCLEYLSIDVSGVLKSPAIIHSHRFLLCLLVSVCMYLGAPILGAYILTSIIFSSWIDSF